VERLRDGALRDPVSALAIALVVFRILLSLGTGYLAVRLLSSSASTAPSASLGRRELIPLGLMILAAMGLRVFMAYGAPIGEYELDSLYPVDLDDLLVILGLGDADPGGLEEWGMHLPLHRVALTPWLHLGLALDVGDLLSWIRLPNVLLSGWVMWLLHRIGRHIEAPAVGWGAAAVFGFTPLLIQFSACQWHYFVEVVAVTWFLERLLACVAAGRPGHTTLAISAAVAVWAGYMTLPILLLGLIAYAWTVVRRGQGRRVLGAGLLFLALTAPLLPLMIETVLFYREVSGTTAGGAEGQGWLLFYFGHDHLGSTPSGFHEAARFLAEGTQMFFGAAGWLVLVMSGMLVLSRPRWGLLILGMFGLYVALFLTLYTRWINFTPMIPLLILTPLWAAVGLEKLPKVRIPHAATLAPAVLAAILVIASAIGSPDDQIRLLRSPYAVQWIAQGRSYQAVAWEIMEEDAEALPVVLFAGRPEDMFLVCRGEPDSVSVMECMRAASGHGPDVAVATFELAKRRVATTGEDWVNAGIEGRCLDWATVLDAAPWRDETFLVLELWRSRDFTSGQSCPIWIPPQRCEVVDQVSEITLWRCPPSGPVDGSR